MEWEKAKQDLLGRAMAEVRATFATAAGQIEARRKEQEAIRVRIVGKRRKTEGTADGTGGGTAPSGAEAEARESKAVPNEGNSGQRWQRCCSQQGFRW